MDIATRMKADQKDSADEISGYQIVKNALEAPFKKLIENAGFDPGQLIAKARAGAGAGQGFDVLSLESAETATPVDMLKAGIVDPLKVVRAAVQNAISVATMILTTEALITDLPEKPPPAPPGMPPGGMDY